MSLKRRLERLEDAAGGKREQSQRKPVKAYYLMDMDIEKPEGRYESPKLVDARIQKQEEGGNMQLMNLTEFKRDLKETQDAGQYYDFIPLVFFDDVINKGYRQLAKYLEEDAEGREMLKLIFRNFSDAIDYISK